jgi:hypothetical protein
MTTTEVSTVLQELATLANHRHHLAQGEHLQGLKIELRHAQQALTEAEAAVGNNSLAVAHIEAIRHALECLHLARPHRAHQLLDDLQASLV